MQEARDRVLAACKKHGIAFLEGGTPANIIARLNDGVRVIADHNEESARLGRAHQKRTMAV
jgi:4-hydroxy-2-oxoheptanedioate aldolase